jgi:hypothetical protein
MGEDNPAPPRQLVDYLVLLRQKDSTGRPFALVGGQAVNYWAAVYLQREPRLQPLMPFLSKDVDLIGTKAEAAQVAARTGWHLSPPIVRGGPVEAVLSSEPDQQGLVADFLLEIKGVSHEDVLAYAQNGYLHVAETGETLRLRVLDPVLLLAGKIRNAVDIEQERPDNPRQDLKHIKILSLCVPHFLEDVRTQVFNPVAQKQICQRYARMLNALRNSYSGRQFQARHPGVFGWENLIPETIRQMLADQSSTLEHQESSGREASTPQRGASTPPQQNDPPTTSEFLSQLRQSSQDEPGDSRSQGRGIRP